MSLINCEINLILNFTGTKTFTITDIKPYIPVVALSTQDNAKILQQLKSGFKGTVNWKKISIKSIKRKKKPKLRLLD